MKIALSAAALLAATAALVFAAPPATQPTTQPAAAYPLKTCVISGEKLGEMGDVVVEKIDGREVHFCCADCAAKFKAGGEESQKKMDAQIIEAQKASYPLTTCVVSGEKFEMQEPVMYVYRPTNQLVKFCCPNCVKQFQQNPAPYLEKLDKASASK